LHNQAMSRYLFAVAFAAILTCGASQVLEQAPSVNSSARSLSPVELVLGCYGPMTSLSTTFLATAVLFDIDLRKQTDPINKAALIAKFGDPIVPLGLSLNSNLRVKFIIGTSDSDPARGVGTALDYFLGRNGVPIVNGVVGGYHSAISMPVASLAAVKKMVQVSWGSTSPKLSNKGAYPYFLRTIPPDSIQGGAMWKFVEFFKVPSVAFLYAEEAYGEGLYTTVANLASTAQQAYRIAGIGVKYMPVDAKANKIYDTTLAGSKIQQALDSKIKFMLLAMTTDQATMLLSVMQTKGCYNNKAYQILGSEAVKYGQATPRPDKDLAQGFLKFNPVNKGPLFPKFEAMWKKLKAADVTGPAAEARYMLAKMQKWPLNTGKAAVPTDAMFADMSKFQLEDPFIFDACYVFAFAFNAMLNAKKTKAQITGKELLDEVYKTKFDGISGTVAFNKDGDRLAEYTVDNYQGPPYPDAAAKGGRRMNVRKEVTVAVYSAISDDITLAQGETMYWMSGDTGTTAPESLTTCSAGYYKNVKTLLCNKCAEGSISAGGTVTKCTRCANGRKANQASAATSCSDCPAGKYSSDDNIGASCTDCSKGYFSDKTKLSMCKKCKISTYSDAAGQTECSKCSTGLITKETAESNQSACVCPEGQYRDLKGSCVGCPAGMTCDAGSYQGLLGKHIDGKHRPSEVSLKVQDGHYTKKEAPMSVYLCEPMANCPGGPVPATCAGLRKSFMCVECPEGSVVTGDLEDDDAENPKGCEVCDETKELYLIAIPILALCALFMVLMDTRHSPLDDDPVKVEIMQVGGQVVMFMQILGALQEAGLKYGEPFTSFTIDLTAPIDMDQFFSGMPCLSFGFVDPTVSFATQVLMPAGFAVALLLVFFLGNTIRKGLFNFDGLLNAIGEVLIEFYVSITIAVMTPFKCYEHPNKKASMVTMPEVLCQEKVHNGLVALAALGMLLYPINCFCTTCFASYKHPRSMARNDIGMLVRCHFLFNRWTPQRYWFAIIAVGRNFFVALWPMVIPQESMDFAVFLMVVSLLFALLLTCWFQPRRTPAMNKLDVFISFVQIVILSVGSMSVYAEEDEAGLKSMGLSAVLVALTISIFVIAAIIAAIKGAQFLSQGATPLSWSFDIVIDFHGGAGGVGGRVLQVFLASCIKRGKVFYDYDSYNANGFLGVITDAAKLTKNFIVILGTETWCRSWCVAAICSAVRKKISMSAITMDGAPFELLTDDDRVIKMLEKQAPRNFLRPLGLADDNVPNAIRKVFQLTPTNFTLSSCETTQSFLDELLGSLKGLRRVKNQAQAQAAITSFFCKNSMMAAQAPGKWYGDLDQKWEDTKGGHSLLCHDYAMLLCDHFDPEAVAASRLMYSGIIAGLNEIQRRLHVVNSAPSNKQGENDDDNKVENYDMSHFSMDEKAAFMETGVIESVGLEAAEFDDLVMSKRVNVTVLLMTDNSFGSAVQMLRLGHIHKFTKPHSRLVAVRIKDSFSLPGKAVLDEIENGTKILFGFNSATEASVKFTTKEVSLVRVVTAVMDCLQTTVSLVDLAGLEPNQMKIRVNKVLLRIIFAARSFKKIDPASEDDDSPRKPIFKERGDTAGRLSYAPGIVAPQGNEV